MVTVKLHPAAWPWGAVAMHMTGVTPSGNAEPLGGTQLTVTGAPQVEVAAGIG